MTRPLITLSLLMLLSHGIPVGSGTLAGHLTVSGLHKHSTTCLLTPWRTMQTVSSSSWQPRPCKEEPAPVLPGPRGPCPPHCESTERPQPAPPVVKHEHLTPSFRGNATVRVLLPVLGRLHRACPSQCPSSYVEVTRKSPRISCTMHH